MSSAYSSSFQILWLLLIAANATTKLLGIIFIPTRSLSNWINTISDFGQILPLLLLAAPILMMFQAFSNETHAPEPSTMPTGIQPTSGPRSEHFEITRPTQLVDANVTAGPRNGSQEDLFSLQHYSEASWMNHMVVLATVGAVLVSWTTALCFTISTSFPHIPVRYFGDRRGSDYVIRTAGNFVLFGWNLMILGHIVILASFNFTTSSKYSKLLIWVLVWSFVAYMSFLVGGIAKAIVFSSLKVPNLPIWGFPILYSIICIGCILQKRVQRLNSVRPGRESFELGSETSPNAAA